MSTFELRCVDDLDEFGAECETELEAYEQDLIHRITTRRGSNIDDENAGESVADWLSIPSFEPGVVSARLEEEIRKDDRTAAITVTISQQSPGVYVVAYEAVTTAGDTLSGTTTVTP